MRDLSTELPHSSSYISQIHVRIAATPNWGCGRCPLPFGTVRRHGIVMCLCRQHGWMHLCVRFFRCKYCHCEDGKGRSENQIARAPDTWNKWGICDAAYKPALKWSKAGQPPQPYDAATQDTDLAKAGTRRASATNRSSIQVIASRPWLILENPL